MGNVTKESIMENRESLLGKPGYAYSTLSDAEQRAYLRLSDTIAHLKPIVKAEYPEDVRESLPKLLAYIDMDHPEFFWMDGYQNIIARAKATIKLIGDRDVLDALTEVSKSNKGFDGDGKVSFGDRDTQVTAVMLEANPFLNWSFDKSLRLSPFWNDLRVRWTRSRFEEYLQGCRDYVAEALTEYQTFRRIFEYVVRNTSYNLRKGLKSQDIRSVFIGRESVCKGYAKALQYLLLDYGIPCFTVSGSHEYDDGSSRAHAWNYVWIDGEWNIVDVTAADWNLDCADPIPQLSDAVRESFVNYRCMCLDGKGYRPTDAIPLPLVGSTSDYFEREGYVLGPDNIHGYATVCSRLYNGYEPFIQVKHMGDYESFNRWLMTNMNLAIRICVAAHGNLDNFDIESSELVPAYTPEDIAKAGWADFGLSVYKLWDENIVLLTCRGGRHFDS